MKKAEIIGRLLVPAVLLFWAAQPAFAGGKLLEGKIVRDTGEAREQEHRFHPATSVGSGILKKLERKHPWSLPTKASAALPWDTVHILVLRYNFQYEAIDDPNTTGRGRMDMSNPFASPTDSANYYNAVGHFIDPPPHDSAYFDAHMRALSNFYDFSSHGRLTITWDIFPPKRDSVYTLPQPMSYYGSCNFARLDSVVLGLENYFIDCIELADSMSPEIDFSKYESFFLFHAGADRQNDIGFPETCEDLFTGFIRFGDSVGVDHDSTFVRTALLMPETASQDNRATALNAVIAHEFGHQLGLVDLYSTYNFATAVGDFATMDHNGFKTGLDFGWSVGSAFGCFPVYHDAWSRAFLGFDSVVDFRQGTDIQIVAANMMKDGIKIARVPISDNEYYLIENRIEDTDGKTTAVLADSATSVIQGPVDLATREFTGEYDALAPGSGLLIYRIDEAVAAMDVDGDGLNNFQDNDLQWIPSRKFMTLIEADGFENLTGLCFAGCGYGIQQYGWAGDMFREDRNNSFTPNTNPRAFDGTGNNTHVRITNIRRDTSVIPDDVLDAVIKFNVETDGMVNRFPLRVGYPRLRENALLAPIADDLDGNGEQEIIVASGQLLTAMTTTGRSFLNATDSCALCSPVTDTAVNSLGSKEYAVPIYYVAPALISAGPVTGDFGAGGLKYTAFSYLASGLNRVALVSPLDNNDDGQADLAGIFNTNGTARQLAFGNALWVVTDSGNLYHKRTLAGGATLLGRIPDSAVFGICEVDSLLVIAAGNDTLTHLYLATPTAIADTLSMSDNYSLGPISVDIDLDSDWETLLFSPEGEGWIVGVNMATSTLQTELTDNMRAAFSTSPVIADIDFDGEPDIVIGGENKLYAFNSHLIRKPDFPMEMDDRFPNIFVDPTPIIADIDGDKQPDIIASLPIGNLYSFGPDLSSGFPLSSGERMVGSPLYCRGANGGSLGYIGEDGWFYLWEMATDSTRDFWPMAGHDASGSYSFDVTTLTGSKAQSAMLPKSAFFSYPNPVTTGSTTLRYTLGQEATKVELKLFDLSGVQVASLNGPITEGENEMIWNCSGVTPGVYRCVIQVDFGGKSEHAFTDVAVIR